MSPILLRFAFGDQEFVLRAYGTFYALAWVVAPILGAYVAHRRGLPYRRVLALYAIALAAGVIGGRLLDLFVAWRYYAADPSRIWALSFAGFSLYGGLVVATLVGVTLARVWRLPVWRLADAAVPSLLVGQVLMRTGCLLQGCCYGEPSELPWAITYPAGSPAWLSQFTQGTGGLLASFMGIVEPVHPTQLYEVSGVLLFGALALYLMRRGATDGVPFLTYALGFTLVRFGNHFLRARQPVITAPEWFYPVFYTALAALIAVLLVWRSRARRAAEPITEEADSRGSRL